MHLASASIFRTDLAEIQGAHHAIPIGATTWHRCAEVAVGTRPISARTIVPCVGVQSFSVQRPSRVQEIADKTRMLYSLRAWQDAGHNLN